MATAKPAHLTIGNKPLCECEGHLDGLMNRLGLTCGHKSIAAAQRAKRELQKHRADVHVRPWPCPVSA